MKMYEVAVSYNREGFIEKWKIKVEAENEEQAKYIAERDHDATGRPVWKVESIKEI